MRRGASLMAVGALCLGIGCSGATSGKPGTDKVEPGTDSGNAAAIANPASTNCLEVGGKLEITEGPNGQVGVCIFADGSRCEEWRLLRGECQPGACRDEGGVCGSATP